MPQQLTESEFRQAEDAAIARAPAGMDETQFNAYMEQAIRNAEREKQNREAAAAPQRKTLGEAMYAASPLPLFEKEQLPSTLAALGGAAATGVTGGLALPIVAAGLAGGLGEAGVAASEGASGSEIATRGLKRGGIEAALSAAPAAVVGTARKIIGPLASWGGRRAVINEVASAQNVIAERAAAEGRKPMARKAEEIADTIIQHRIKTPEAAEDVLQGVRGELRADAAAATRAGKTLDLEPQIQRNVKDLAEGVEKHYLPGEVRPGVQDKVRELLKDSPLTRRIPGGPDPHIPRAEYEQEFLKAISQGIDEARRIPRTLEIKPWPVVKGPMPEPGQFAGQFDAFPKSQVSREIRPDLTPSEALDIIEQKSYFGKGDLPAGAEETAKQIELAVRDAFKEAVPSAERLQGASGALIDAKRVLDPIVMRGIKRGMTVPALIGGVGTVASGANLPKGIALAVAIRELQKRQLSLGVDLATKVGPFLSQLGKRPAGLPAEAGAVPLRTMLMELMELDEEQRQRQ
jgi:hypothetical protein